MPDSIVKVDNLASMNGTGVGIPDGTVASPGLKFTADGDSGLYRIGANNIGIATNGTRVGEIGVGYGGFTGNIIQVQSTTKSNIFTTSSTSFVDVTGLNVNITPKYATSKILVMMGISYGTDNVNTFQARVLRDGTAIGIGDADPTYPSRSRTTVGGQRTNDSASALTQSIQFLDSPSSTSTLNYKIQVIAQGGNLYVNTSADTANDISRGTTISCITVMEIQQ